MTNLVFIFSLSMFFIVFARRVAGQNVEWELEESSNENISDSNSAITEICDCANYTCVCCVKGMKTKVCNIGGIVETRGPGKSNFSLVWNVTINGNQVLSDTIPVSSLPGLCYSLSRLGGCFRLTLRRREAAAGGGLELCLALQLQYNGTTFFEPDLFCRRLPPGNRPGMRGIYEKEIVSGSSPTNQSILTHKKNPRAENVGYYKDHYKNERWYGHTGSTSGPVIPPYPVWKSQNKRDI